MNFKRGCLFFLKTIGVVFALLIFYVIAGLSLTHIGVNKTANDKISKDVTIYIQTNGVHTDIVVPVKNEWMDWSSLVRYQDTDRKDSTQSWVSFGWGDKGFYLQTPEWKDLKISVALKAAFHLGTAALHATFYRSIETGPECVQLNISKDDYLKLADYIRNSFLLDANGNSIHIFSEHDGYGDADAFYEAKGAYSLFYTCNSWANGALKACGLPAAWWALRDKDIFRNYQKQSNAF